MQRWKTFLIWVGAVGLLVFARANWPAIGYRGILSGSPRTPGAAHSSMVPIDVDTALEMLEAELVIHYAMIDGNLILQSEQGQWFTVEPPSLQTPNSPQWQVYRALSDQEIPALQVNVNRQHPVGSENARRAPVQDETWSTLMTLLPFAIAFGAVVYFLRRRGGMSTIFEMRKSRARVLDADQRASFAAVGGNAEAIELLRDVTDFLSRPRAWQVAGARLPRGVLVIGPPGTGKTLLARAVAGESGASFHYTSAAEFTELLVGVGAARVRDTFEKAMATRPAIIFIDEIDAIGRRRGSGGAVFHEEREQTLNQLLVAMDGLVRHDQLVVMAATNRPDVLDPALLRSGRFDRTLKLTIPDRDARLAILKIHTQNKHLANDVSLEEWADRTDGLTGADLEMLANEATLFAVRRQRANGDPTAQTLVTNADVTRAWDGWKTSNPRFNKLDTLLVESATQFAEPTGRAAAIITLASGAVLEGDVQWMNATHIKLKLTDGTEAIVLKAEAERIIAAAGTETDRDASASKQ